MFFISNRTKAQFYNDSQMTFLVQKDHVDIIFKVNKGIYLTVEVYSLSEGRLLLACTWGEFWNRLKRMRNREEVLAKLKKACPLAANIFTNQVAPHFAYLDPSTSYFDFAQHKSGTGQTQGAVVVEMKAPAQTNSIADYLHEKVVEKAMELMKYNLNLYVELDEKCPFAQWKSDLKNMK